MRIPVPCQAHTFGLGVCWLVVIGCADHDRAREERFDRWSAVEDLRIGSADDPEYAFAWISSIAVGADGSIYSVHPNEQTVRRFSRDGVLLGTVGRRGGGPGEFGNPLTLGWLADTLWVYDAALYRFSLFTADGQLVRTVSPYVLAAQHATDRPARPHAMLPDGTLLGSVSSSSELVDRGIITTRPILHIAIDGRVLDTIAVLPFTRNSGLTIRGPHGAIVGRQPFADEPLGAVSEVDSSYVVVERKPARDETPARYRVIKLNLAGDTVLQVERPYTPRPIAAAYLDSIIDTWATSVMQSQGARAPSHAVAREWVRKALYLPGAQAPVRNLVVGRDGLIWLERDSVANGTARWDVLSPAGQPRGTVQLPAQMRLLSADATHVYGTVADVDDVPYIVRLRIRR